MSKINFKGEILICLFMRAQIEAKKINPLSNMEATLITPDLRVIGGS